MKRDCKIRPIIFVCVSITGKTTRSSPTGYFKLEFAVGFFLLPLSLSQYLGLLPQPFAKQRREKGANFINKISGGKTQPNLAISVKACAFLLGPTIYLYTSFTAKHVLSLILLCSRLSSDHTTSLFDLPTTPFPCEVMTDDSQNLLYRGFTDDCKSVEQLKILR